MNSGEIRREASCGAIGEGNERGRYVHVIERAGHGVLAADGRETQVLLRGVCAEQGGQRFAEALRVLAETLEVFLEGQVAVSKSQPAATSLATDSITAAEAPRYGFCSVKYGSKPKAMTDAVSH